MSVTDDDIDIAFTFEDYTNIKTSDFPTQLEVFGFDEEERSKIVEQCRGLRDLFCILGDKESWKDMGVNLRIPVKLRIKRFRELDGPTPTPKETPEQDNVAQDSAQTIDEHEMEMVGRQRSQNNAHNAVVKRENQENYKKALSSAAFPVVFVRAGIVRSLQVGEAAMASWIGAVVVLTAQTAYHSYRYFRGDISWQQLIKYTGVNAFAGGASVGGAVGGALIGSALGSIVPGIGTFIGGIVGSILASILCGVLAQYLGSWIGNKFVNDEEHTRNVERKKQYAEALRIFGLEGVKLSKEYVEQTKRAIFKSKHPDKFPGDKAAQAKAHAEFVSVCGAYYVILQENGWDNTPPLETEDSTTSSEVPSNVPQTPTDIQTSPTSPQPAKLHKRFFSFLARSSWTEFK